MFRPGGYEPRPTCTHDRDIPMYSTRRGRLMCRERGVGGGREVDGQRRVRGAVDRDDRDISDLIDCRNTSFGGLGGMRRPRVAMGAFVRSAAARSPRSRTKRAPSTRTGRIIH
eukprot:5728369-Prymnesium_polylepis.1